MAASGADSGQLAYAAPSRGLSGVAVAAVYCVGWLALAVGGNEIVLALIEAGEGLRREAVFARIAGALTQAVAPGVLILGFGALLSLVRRIAAAAETERRPAR